VIAAKLKRSKATVPAKLEPALNGLLKLNIDGLRATWAAWLSEDPPRCQSKDLLRYLLAWRVQEQRFGGLSADTKRRLKELVASVRRGTKIDVAPAKTLQPGIVISRDWRGVVHRVHVLEDEFAYEGKRFGSLSVIARKITGTRWSGPRFFGIEARKAPSEIGAAGTKVPA
jgi:hypothetical protein